MNHERAGAIVGALTPTVQHIAVCPGSRSTPLALAAAHHPDVTLHVILDERSAGFWAVGVARATGRPAAIITTSGTAVANLHPAVVEADMAALPMVLLSADRPAYVRGTGANQTIDQVGLFGRHVRAHADLDGDDVRPLLEAAVGPCPGPVHINVPFDEPLTPEGLLPEPVRGDAIERAKPPASQPMALEGRGLIVAGPGPVTAEQAARIEAAARRLHAPILADPLGGVDGLWCQDAVLLDPRPSLTPDWIVQFGHTPVSKRLNAWIRDHPGRHRIDPTGRRWDEGDPAWMDGDPADVLDALSGGEPWDAWHRTQAAMTSETPPEVEALRQAMGRPGAVFVGNSLPIRDVDRFLTRRRGVHANRGASGIDGNLATATGLNVAGPVTAIVGDLTFQHDVGSLALIAERDVRVVVIRNGGGQIFRHLPIADATEHFERLFVTPQRFDIAAACTAFGLSHEVASPGDVRAALERSRVVEVVVDGAVSAAERDRTTKTMAAAARAALP